MSIKQEVRYCSLPAGGAAAVLQMKSQNLVVTQSRQSLFVFHFLWIMYIKEYREHGDRRARQETPKAKRSNQSISADTPVDTSWAGLKRPLDNLVIRINRSMKLVTARPVTCSYRQSGNPCSPAVIVSTGRSAGLLHHPQTGFCCWDQRLPSLTLLC